MEEEKLKMRFGTVRRDREKIGNEEEWGHGER